MSILDDMGDFELPPCKYCGRVLYCGGPCCVKAALDIIGLLTGERDHARKLQGREAKRANQWMKSYQDAMAAAIKAEEELKKFKNLAERVAYAPWDASRVDDLREALGIRNDEE